MEVAECDTKDLQASLPPPGFVHEMIKTPPMTSKHEVTCSAFHYHLMGLLLPVRGLPSVLLPPTYWSDVAFLTTRVGCDISEMTLLFGVVSSAPVTSRYGTNLQEYSLFPIADPRARPFKTMLFIDKK